MNWQLLWFVLAGLVLGFALSTLWEWFYFRRERMSVSDERIDELEAQLRAYEERDRAQATAAPPWTAPAYQGPGVLLESEQGEEAVVDRDDRETLAERSEPLASQATDENDADDSGIEAPESDVEQLETTAVVVEETLLVEDDSAVQTVVEEDDPLEPDTLNRTAVAGAAIAATAVTATVLGDAVLGDDVVSDDVLSDDVSEELESSDSADADPEVTQDFVSPDADTENEEPEISASEDLLSDAVTAAGLATVAAAKGEGPEDSADATVIEPSDQDSETQADEFDVALAQDTIDDVVDGSADDQSDEQPTMPSDDKTAASVDESVTETADELTAALLDDEVDGGIDDDINGGVDAPVDEAAAEQVDEGYDTQAERSVVEEIDVQTDIVDGESIDEAAGDVSVDAADEPTEALTDEPADGSLDDEDPSDFAPLRVDDLAPSIEPAERSAEIPDELLGAALLASAVGDGEAVDPKPGPTSNDPIIWKPEEIRGHPDNLSRIKGIGKVYRARLYDAAVFTWHQLSQMSEDEIREIVHPFVSADVEEWPKRARELAERNGRIGAQYVGPPPDDLMEIRGIGSYAMQRLYKSGIWSFQQLAAKSPEELEAILPVSPSGEAIDYQRWIIIATQMSEERSG